MIKRLAVFGSRVLFGDAVKKIIARTIQEHGYTVIVTAGEPSGVCATARELSQALSVPLKLHWLNAKERAAGKYHWRSVAVLSDCDAALFIHDGKSKGTKNEIEVARKRKVPFIVEHLDPSVTALDFETTIKMLGQ